MDYHIVATLGPSSPNESVWRGMLAAGVTAFRLNTSHLSGADLLAWLEALDRFLPTLSPRPPLVLDLQGSKWRLGEFLARELAAGQTLRLVHAAATEGKDELPVPHADFFQAAPDSSDEIALNDGKVYLKREAVEPGIMHTAVVRGGPISPRKGITYTHSAYRIESISETDRAVLAQTRSLPGVRYALSYIKDAEEMARYRRQIGSDAYLIAKIERPQAVEQAMEVAAFADEAWLCRGDLGAELGLPAMALAAHRFGGLVGELRVPALLAGQVFEHLVEHATPTRSEVTAVYDALAQGYRGLVLSDETAVGRDPVEACRVAAIFKASAFLQT
jgi:pyruvate kinase